MCQRAEESIVAPSVAGLPMLPRFLAIPKGWGDPAPTLVIRIAFGVLRRVSQAHSVIGFADIATIAGIADRPFCMRQPARAGQGEACLAPTFVCIPADAASCCDVASLRTAKTAVLVQCATRLAPTTQLHPVSYARQTTLRLGRAWGDAQKCTAACYSAIAEHATPSSLCSGYAPMIPARGPRRLIR